MLSQILRLTALFAISACVTTVACGLSVVGTTEASDDDAGFDATVDHVAHLPGDDDDDGGDTTTTDGSIKDAGHDGDATLITVDADADVDAAVPCAELTLEPTLAGMLNGHCYFALMEGSGTANLHGDQARTNCQNAGAHLVTITSQQEQDFVVGLGDSTFRNNSRWIGLTATAPTNSPSNFTWITGESMSYSHWDSNQPNADGVCAVVKGESSGPGAGWQDRDCSGFELAAICERE